MEQTASSRLPKWRIYYSDGSIYEGLTEQDWREARSNGVQVVVRLRKPERPRWTYQRGGQNVLVMDRELWTGEDWFDPFGWGEKQGELIADDDYLSIWERACGDS